MVNAQAEAVWLRHAHEIAEAVALRIVSPVMVICDTPPPSSAYRKLRRSPCSSEHVNTAGAEVLALFKSCRCRMDEGTRRPQSLDGYTPGAMKMVTNSEEDDVVVLAADSASASVEHGVEGSAQLFGVDGDGGGPVGEMKRVVAVTGGGRK